jgi:uncharacterized damage-inducible protein DinB
MQSIVDALDRAPSIVIPLVRQASPAIVKTRPPSGKWSIHEHACHLADVHTLFVRRLDVMLAEDDPVIRSYDPGRDDQDDRLLREELDEALERFTSDRARLVERLRRLTPAEWARTARHDEYNSYSVATMFRHLTLHDFFHAYRIEELVLRRDWPAPTVSWD